MKIPYANTHSWWKPITPDVFSNYGASDSKRIRKLLQMTEHAAIDYRIEPANQTFFDWFEPMYQEHIRSRSNPRPANVFEMTAGNPKALFPFFTLTVTENGRPVGGCVFSDRNTHYSIAYRIYEPRWSQIQKVASPAIFGEFQLDQYSLDHGKERLVHGQDRNPYGLNSGIGLAIFKLAVGCSAKLPPTHEVSELDTDTLTTDVLVLQYPESGRDIQRAVLVATPEVQERYSQLFTYEHKLAIEVIHRNPS